MLNPIESLSSCALDYLLAQTDPFLCPEGELPCIPDTVVIPSRKYLQKASGTFIVNTSGDGWILFNPWTCVNNTGVQTSTTDRPLVYTIGSGNSSLIGFGVNAGSVLDSGGVQLGSSSMTGDFTSALNVGQRYRLVGAGIKISYIGTALNLSGQVITYREPTSQQVGVFPVFSGNGSASNPNFSTLLSRDISLSSRAINREEEYSCVYRLSDPDDLVYRPWSQYAPSQVGSFSSTTSAWAMAIAVSGCVAGTSFKWEAVSIVEAIGGSVGAVTKSHSDPLAFAAIETALPVMQMASTPAENLERVIPEINSALREMTPFNSLLASTANGIYDIARIGAGGLSAAGLYKVWRRRNRQLLTV